MPWDAYGWCGSADFTMYGNYVYTNSKILSNKFKPTRIIYNDPVTICFFTDGSKIMVKCSKEEKYVPEYGVMACIIKKLFGSRSEFLRLVASGYQQPKKIE